MPPCTSGTQGKSNDAARRSKEASGGLAQLGEHLLCKQGVVGSIPSSSTKCFVMFNIQVDLGFR